MPTTNDKILSREVDAVLIPAGDKVKLPAGIKLTITHRLGGNFTVTSDWGMFRISGSDADALNEPIPSVAQQPTPPSSPSLPPDSPPNQDDIWDKLKSVYDPEIPVNIVDLGLVYSMEVLQPKPNFFLVHVAMTLTAPGCGMGPAIAEDAKNRLLTIPNVHEAQVDIVWDPPWSQDMISEAGKMELGLI